MKKAALACIAMATLMLSGCLTREDLDCWYDDMCMTGASPAPAAHPGGEPPSSGR